MKYDARDGGHSSLYAVPGPPVLMHLLAISYMQSFSARSAMTRLQKVSRAAATSGGAQNCIADDVLCE